jgi:hypothetical protein
MVRRPAYLAAFAVVLLVGGQLVARVHEAGTRHVTCAEHGEQLEAAHVQGELHACDDNACDDDHLIGIDDDRGGDHEDCAILRVLSQSSTAGTSPTLDVAAAATITIAAVMPPRFVATATELYRLAPKTSPPV